MSVHDEWGSAVFKKMMTSLSVSKRRAREDEWYTWARSKASSLNRRHDQIVLRKERKSQYGGI